MNLVLDLEMADTGEIIEIGVVSYTDACIKTEYHIMLKPARKLSHMITKFTGITNEMLEHCPSEQEGLEDFFSWLSEFKEPISLWFWGNDDKVLRKSLRRLRMKSHVLSQYTWKDMRVLYNAYTMIVDFDKPSKQSLQAVATALGVPTLEGRHRAVADAAETMRVLQELIQRFKCLP
jgi:DNA polymerase III epsilon subunit-like protein